MRRLEPLLETAEGRRRLRWAGWAVLVLVLLAELGVSHEEVHLSWEGMWGFGAVFGLLASALIIVGSKVLGHWLDRGEDYYDR